MCKTKAINIYCGDYDILRSKTYDDNSIKARKWRAGSMHLWGSYTTHKVVSHLKINCSKLNLKSATEITQQKL